jgi:hypothetical protein
MRMSEVSVKFKSVVKVALVCRFAYPVISRQHAEQICHGFIVCHVNNLLAVVRKFTKTALWQPGEGLSLSAHDDICAGVVIVLILSCYGEKEKAKEDFYS